MPSIQFRTLLFSGFAAAILLAENDSADAATFLSVDMGTATANPFQLWNIGSDGAGPHTTTFSITDFVSVPGGLLSATIGGGSDATNLNNDTGLLNTRSRLNVPVNNGSFTQSNLLTDRVVSTTGSGLFLSLSGFAPSTTFTIQVWGYDTQSASPFGAKPGNFSLFDRTDGANSLVGSFSAVAGALPTDNNTFSVIGTVTSDANGVIVVESVSNMDGTGIMNGFAVSTVPEPASGALFLGGLSIAALRRRRISS